MSQIVHLVYNYNCTPTHRVSLCSMSHIEQLQLYSHTQSVPLLHVTHRTTTTVLPHTECPSAPCHTLYSYNCTPTHSVSLLHVTHCTTTIVLPHTECPSAPGHDPGSETAPKPTVLPPKAHYGPITPMLKGESSIDLNGVKLDDSQVGVNYNSIWTC